MILADDKDILQRLQAVPEAPPDSFPRSGPSALGRALDAASGTLKAVPEAVGAAAEFGGEFGADLAQPGAVANQLAPGFRAGLARAREVDNFYADDYVLGRQYQPVIEAINRGLPPDQELPNPFDVNLGGYAEAQGVAKPLPNGAMRARDNVIPLVWARVAQLRQDAPQLVANIPASQAELMEDALAEQRTALGFSAVASQTRLGALGNLAGGLVGSLTDPPNVLAAMLGAPASTSLLKTFVLEGGLNLALDAAGLPSRAARYRRLGQPMSAKDVATELGLDFVVGGALPTGIKAGLESLFPEVRTAARLVEDARERAAQNPFADSDVGRDQMRAGALSAMTALDDGRLDLVPDTRAQLGRAFDPTIDLARRREGFTVEAMDRDLPRAGASAVPDLPEAELRDAQVMANALAARSDLWRARQDGLADLSGAPDAPAWQEARRPLALAFEDAGGTRSLLTEPADYGVTLREVDGFTREQAQAIARIKGELEQNIATIKPLIVARRKPNGGVVYGKPGQLHADLFKRDIDYERASDAQMGFATELGAPFMSREQAFEWVKKNQPAAIKRQFEAPAIEANQYFENVRAIQSLDEPNPGSLSHPPVSPDLDEKALANFSDPAAKPEAFARQSQDIAADLAPARNGADLGEKLEGAPEFGPAQAEIEAIRALDQAAKVPDALSEAGEISVRDLRRRLEREARAVEALRACMGGRNAI